MLVLRTMVHMHLILVNTVATILRTQRIILILAVLQWRHKQVTGRIVRIFFVVEIGRRGLLVRVVCGVLGALLLFFIQWLDVLDNTGGHMLQRHSCSVTSIGLIRLQCLNLLLEDADFFSLFLHLYGVLLFLFIEHLRHLLRLLKVLLLILLNIV